MYIKSLPDLAHFSRVMSALQVTIAKVAFYNKLCYESVFEHYILGLKARERWTSASYPILTPDGEELTREQYADYITKNYQWYNLKERAEQIASLGILLPRADRYLGQKNERCEITNRHACLRCRSTYMQSPNVEESSSEIPVLINQTKSQQEKKEEQRLKRNARRRQYRAAIKAGRPLYLLNSVQEEELLATSCIPATSVKKPKKTSSCLSSVLKRVSKAKQALTSRSDNSLETTTVTGNLETRPSSV